MDITTTQTMNGVKMSAQNSGRDIQLVLESLKKQVAIDRCVLVKKKMEENRQKLIGITKHVHSATKMRMSNTICADNCVDLLTKRQQDALCTLNGAKEDHEESNARSIVPIGNSSGVKNFAHPVTLAKVSKIPPYTTWVFLKRNQRMTEDQSVVGRRRIYYDQIGGEALIASDSEEEEVGDEEDQKEFSDAEDFILRNAIQQVGLSVDVLNSLAKCFSRRPSDIKADLKDETKIEDIFCDKDLDAALDSFDNLFCRRCLVFDCRLHGCSQDLVFPAEKQLPWAPPDSETTLNSESVASGSCSAPGGFEDKAIASSGSGGHQTSRGKKTKSNQSDHTSNARNILDISELDIRSQEEKFSTQQSSPPNKRVAGHIVSSMQKRRKKLSASDSDSVADGSPWIKDRKLRSSSRKDNEDQNETLPVEAQQEPCHKMIKDYLVECNDDTSRVDELADENMDKPWSTFEKCLYSKGLDMFGKNSCLIARNLLVGMKTCAEVFQYMSYTKNKLCHRAEGSNSAEGQTQGDHNDTTGRTGSRFMRRKGKVRRVNLIPVTANLLVESNVRAIWVEPAVRNIVGVLRLARIALEVAIVLKVNAEADSAHALLQIENVIQMFVGIVGCGDGTLGGPPQRGDNYECRNMKLLLKQQQRVLLGRSDVSGWGAFLKNGVNKNEYLGEYTGELISHREADKLGKIYDLENSAASWAKKPEILGSKKVEVASSIGRAKKRA
ncbi:hypothetical protein C5167_039922 [Papaver somniferum]|uniref:Histone-lysine N-methyltransferase CLF-like HTH domain-containing protein n=1 Tax=Papaver somniferum TaxID=3469 RepID=A0A4Y7IDF9_PAPSO|nr:hypothetical protein C5167_039922 [Papaver somniferum]